MKTNTLPIKALIAVIAAIVFLPVGPVAASIAFTMTGLSAMLASDYGRNLEPVRAQAGVIPHDFRGRGAADLGKAA
jgi:hypothetical protein